MKSFKIILASAVLCVAIAAPALRAQPDGPPPAGERGGKPGKSGPRGDRLKMLSEQLALTDAQKTSVTAILKDERAAMEALSEEDRMAGKGQEIRKAHGVQIRALLTPEQQAKFDAMPKGRGPGGPGGKPKEPKS